MQIEGVSISLKRIRRRALYAYQGIECILPLRGQLTVERNGCSFLLETDHVLVLNNGELHAFPATRTMTSSFCRSPTAFCCAAARNC